MEEGDSFSFKTQDGPEYAGNTKCQVTYEAGITCPSISFSCSKFDLTSASAKCKGGDKITITADGASKK